MDSPSIGAGLRCSGSRQNDRFEYLRFTDPGDAPDLRLATDYHPISLDHGPLRKPHGSYLPENLMPRLLQRYATPAITGGPVAPAPEPSAKATPTLAPTTT